MTDTLMWQVHPPLVQPSSSQVRDIGIVENPCPTEHGRDWTQLWPGVVHNLCTWVHLRNRGSRQGRDETTKWCRFNAFSGRKKKFRKSGEILQEVGHQKTKLQMNGKSLPLSFSWRRSHSVPIITRNLRSPCFQIKEWSQIWRVFGCFTFEQVWNKKTRYEHLQLFRFCWHWIVIP